MKLQINPARLAKLLTPAADLAAQAGSKVPALTMIHGLPNQEGILFTGSDGVRFVRTQFVAQPEGGVFKLTLSPGEFMRALQALGEEDAYLECAGPGEQVQLKSKTAIFRFRQTQVVEPELKAWTEDETANCSAQGLAAAIRKVSPVVDSQVKDNGLTRENCLFMDADDSGSVICYASSNGLFIRARIEAIVSEAVRYVLPPGDCKLLGGILDGDSASLRGVRNLVVSSGRHLALSASPDFSPQRASDILAAQWKNQEPTGTAVFSKIDIESALSRAAVFGAGEYRRSERRPLFITFSGDRAVSMFSSVQYSSGKYDGAVPCEWSGSENKLNLDHNRLKVALQAMDTELVEMRWVDDSSLIEIRPKDGGNVQAVIQSVDKHEDDYGE